MQFNINVTSLLKYLFSTVIVFGFTYVLITMFLEYKISIFEFLPQVIGLTIISGIGYIGLTYAIDNKTRILVKAVISELLPRKEKS
jgi:hypothetical protein